MDGVWHTDTGGYAYGLSKGDDKKAPKNKENEEIEKEWAELKANVQESMRDNSAVIILGVPPEVSHAELLEKLSTYGTVCSLRAREDNLGHICEFSRPDMAQHVLTDLNGHIWNGSALKVQYVTGVGGPSLLLPPQPPRAALSPPPSPPPGWKQPNEGINKIPFIDLEPVELDSETGATRHQLLPGTSVMPSIILDEAAFDVDLTSEDLSRVEQTSEPAPHTANPLGRTYKRPGSQYLKKKADSDNPKPARGSPFSFGPPKPPSTPSQSKQVPDTAQTKKKVTDTVKPKEIPHTARPSMDGAPSQDKPIPLMGLFAKPKEKEDTPENKQSPSPPSLDDKDNDTKESTDAVKGLAQSGVPVSLLKLALASKNSQGFNDSLRKMLDEMSSDSDEDESDDDADVTANDVWQSYVLRATSTALNAEEKKK